MSGLKFLRHSLWEVIKQLGLDFLEHQWHNQSSRRSGRGCPRHWKRSWTQVLLHRPTPKPRERSTPGNCWWQQGSWGKPRVSGAPCGHQASLDNTDLDFVAQLVEVKSNSKLKLNTALFKSILRQFMSTTENRSQVFSQMKLEEILVLEQGEQNWP